MPKDYVLDQETEKMISAINRNSVKAREEKANAYIRAQRKAENVVVARQENFKKLVTGVVISATIVAIAIGYAGHFKSSSEYQTKLREEMNAIHQTEDYKNGRITAQHAYDIAVDNLQPMENDTKGKGK